jgi:hypothetical protein
MWIFTSEGLECCRDNLRHQTLAPDCTRWPSNEGHNNGVVVRRRSGEYSHFDVDRLRIRAAEVNPFGQRYPEPIEHISQPRCILVRHTVVRMRTLALCKTLEQLACVGARQDLVEELARRRWANPAISSVAVVGTGGARCLSV